MKPIPRFKNSTLNQAKSLRTKSAIKKSLAAFAGIGPALIAQSAHAADVTWTSGTSANWSVTSNWTSGAVPLNTQTVSIANTAADTLTVATGTAAAASMSFDNISGKNLTLAISSGASLSVGGAMIQNGAGTVTMSISGSLSTTGAITGTGMTINVLNGGSLFTTGSISGSGISVSVANTTQANAASVLSTGGIYGLTTFAFGGAGSQYLTTGFDITTSVLVQIGVVNNSATFRQTGGTITSSNGGYDVTLVEAASVYTSGTTLYIMDGGTLKVPRFGVADGNGNNVGVDRWAVGNGIFQFNNGTVQQNTTNGTLNFQNGSAFLTYTGTGTKDMGLNVSKPLTIQLSSTGTHTFNADGASGNIYISPSAQVVDQAGGAGTLSKTGLGNLVFTGNGPVAVNSWTGNTTVAAGKVMTDYSTIAGQAATGGTDSLSNAYSPASRLVLGGGNYELRGRGSAVSSTATGVSLAVSNYTQTVASTTGLVVGEAVTNSFLPAGTYIRSILNGTQIQLNAMSLSTSTQASQSLVFGAGTFANTQTINNVEVDQPAASTTVTVTPGAGSSTTLLTFGAVSGTGGFTKAGAGMLSLTGSLTYTGTTAISAGTLDIAPASGTSTFAGAITGSGTFSKSGNSMVIVSSSTVSVNTFNGAVVVNSGTLQLGNSGTSNSSGQGIASATSWNIGSGATVVLKNSAAIGSALTLSGMLTTDSTNVFGGGFYNTLGALTMNGGTLQTGAGANSSSWQCYALGGDVTVTGTTPSSMINGGPGGTAGNGIHLAANSTGTRTFNVADVTGNSAVDLTVAASLVNSSNTLAAINLLKSGSGTMLLSGSNGYTGSTAVNAGTLAFTVGNALKNTSGVTVANGASLAFTGATSEVLTGVPISGSGTFVVAGVGTGALSLGGTGSYSGGTTVSSGALSWLTASAQPGTGTTAVAAGATLGLGVGGSGSFVSTNIDNLFAGSMTNVTIDPAANVGIDTTASNFTYSSNVAGTRGLNKLGANTLTLTGSNSYSGATIVSSGTLQLGDGTLGHDSAIPSASVLNNAALAFNYYGNQTCAGAIGGMGSLTKLGTAAVTLSGSNTYTGVTTIASGTLQFAKEASLYGGNPSNWTAPNLVAASGATAVFNVGGSGEFVASDIDTLKALGTGSNGFKSGAILGLDTTDAAGGVFTYSSGIANPNSGANTLGLIKLGSNTLVLNGSSSYTGTTTVNSGTLQIGDGINGSISGSSAITLNSGAGLALNLAGSGTFASAITSSIGSAITMLSSGTTTLTGNIIGPAGLNQSGSGMSILTGVNSYAGTTNITAGVLQLSGSNAAFVSTVNVGINSGLVFGINGVAIGGLSGAGAVSLVNGTNAMTLTVGNSFQNATYSGTLSGVGNLTKTGVNTQSMTGSLAYTGTTSISAGTLDIAQASGSATLAGVIVGSGTFSKSGNGLLVVSNTANANTFSGAVVVNSGTLQLGYTSITNTAGQGLWNASSYVVASGATMVLRNSSAFNNYAPFILSGTLTTDTSGVASSGFFSPVGPLTMNGGTLQTSVGGNNSNFQCYAFNGDVTVTGTTPSSIINGGPGGNYQNAIHLAHVATGATRTFHVADVTGDANPDLIVAASFVNSSSTWTATSLAKDGAGTMLLSGSNGYTGSTTVNAGTMAFSVGNALKNTSGVSIASGASLTFTGSTSEVLTGVPISGSGIFVVAGASTGALSLGGTSSYSGGTTVSSGALSWLTPSAQPPTGTTTVAAGATLGLGVGGSTSFVSTNLDSLFAGSMANVTLDPAANAGIDTTAGNFTYSSNVAGTLGLNKMGANTLTLTGSNSYSGPTIVTSGTLQLGDGTFGHDSTISGASAVINATLAFNLYANQTYAGAISGTGGMTKLGPATVILTGSNTYTGATTISSGTLQFGKTASLYNDNPSSWTVSNLVVASGATAAFNVGGSGEFAGSDIDTLKALGTGSNGFKSGAILGLDTTNAAGGTFTYTSGIANPNSGANVLSLEKTGANTLVLTGSSSYTGGTTVNGGTLQIGNGSSGSIAGAGTVTVNPGATLALNLATGGTNSNAIAIVSGATVSAMESGTMTLAGNITGAGGVTQNGAGRTILIGTNSFSGPTNIDAGVLQLNATSAANMTTVNVGLDNGLQFGGNTILVGGLSGSGAIALLNGTSGVALTVGNNNQSSTYSGIISGTNPAGSLTKTGTGTWTLTGSNSFVGATTVNAGTIKLGNAYALAQSGTVTVNSANGVAFGSGITAVTLKNLNGSGGVSLANDDSNAVTLTANNAANESFAGIIGGIGNFVKAGGGVLSVNGANTYTGKTSISGGNLYLTSIGNVNGGASSLGNPSDATAGAIDISNNGGLQYVGGGASTDRVLNMGLGTPNASLISSGSGLLTWNGAVNVNVSSAWAVTPGAINADILINGKISGNAQNGLFASQYGGTLTLANPANDFTGGITIYNGIVSIPFIANSGTASALGNGGNISLGGGGYNFTGTLQFTGTGGGSSNRPINIFGAPGYSNGGIIENTVAGQTLTLSGAVTPTGPAPRLQLIGAGNGVLSGAIASGGTATTLSLIKSGPGIWTLSGSNAYTGATTLNSGELSVGASGNLGAPASSLVFNGGVLKITGTALTSCSGLGHTVSFTAGQTVGLDIASAGNMFTVDQALNQGAGGFNKSGAGTVVLSQPNTYTGATTINAGVLQLGNGGTTGSISSSSTLVDNGTLAFNRADSITEGADFPATISGSGSIVQAGIGLTILSGSNSHSGGTTVSGGTLQLGNANALGAGGLAVNNGTLDLAGNSVSVPVFSGTGAGALMTNSVSGTSTLTTTVASGTSTYAGNIADGAGSVVLNSSGAGTLILSGSLTMTGLNANSGVTQLTQSGSIGAVSVAAGATVAMQAHSGGNYNVLNVSSLTISGFSSGLVSTNNAATAGATYTPVNAGTEQNVGILTDTGRALAQAPATGASEPASPESVPEPGTLGLLLTGALGLLGLRRKGSRHAV